MSRESLLWTAATDTAARIERVLAETVGTLARSGIEATLVEGSALSAELSSSHELMRRFASRASLSIRVQDIEHAERTLTDAGWHRSEPQGDMHLLRTASRHGRHLVFALLDRDEDADGPPPLHPTHPDAVRRRNARLSRWRTAVRLTLARQHTHEDEVGRTVTETFELSIVEAAVPSDASGSGQ
jgi:DNA-binding transcriptional ArsR family regulator